MGDPAKGAHPRERAQPSHSSHFGCNKTHTSAIVE
jgi:hypothetical protein